ncbi:MAG: acetylglutamate kinase [Deltaproteobacteria bacterium]|nr:acetylglutamate kinase [Deltaproteobacteria bacterium]MBW2444991.1 acetylglutamate kinase [Deltaproteobacteria bacterium]
MRRFFEKTVVIKYGGSAMVDESLRESFAVDVVLLKYIGLRPVLVHGGGPQIGRALASLGKESKFIDGLRVTDDATMEVVERVLGGEVNASIVELVERAGGRGLGLTGQHDSMLRVERKRPGGKDLGRVGQVVKVECEAIVQATQQGYIPVVAPIGVDPDGVTHNVNADEAAGALAVALGAEKLMLLTDVEGVLDAKGALMSQLTVAEVAKHIDEGTIRGGMIPKVECCLQALDGKVGRAHVVDGRVLHAVLLEIFTDGGVGTVITH